MQLSQGAKRTDLHPDYAAIGAMHEDLHSAQHPEAQREVPFKRVVSNNAILSGRADFVFEDRVDECKATFSDATVRNAKAGTPELSHLAQLVCYLMEFGLSRGRLIYGYFVKAKDGALTRRDTAVIEVTIADDRILVNSKDTGYSTSDLVNTILQVSEWMQTDRPAPRPAKNGYASACKYCPLNMLCDRIDDQKLTIQQVKSEAIELIEAKPQATPKPKKEK
jgi:CRISPR/Cas system-associated exonuclease Cas4 (RecB family)